MTAANPAEEPGTAVAPPTLGAQRLVELLRELALPLVELARNEDIEDDSLIAPTTAAQPGQAQTAKDDLLARLRPGRYLHVLLPVERRDLDRPAEHRAGRRHLCDGHEVLALAVEPLVLGHHDLDVEIARRAARIAGVAGAPHADPLPGFDAGRDVELPRSRAHDPALPLALPARGLRHLALPAAGRTHAASDQLPEHGPRNLADLSNTPAPSPPPPRAAPTPLRPSCPNTVLEPSRISPTPPQVSHVRIGVPGSAPLPWQCSHTDTASNERSRLAPVTTSSRVTSTCAATSAPPAGPPRPKPNRSLNIGSPRPKNADSTSSKLPKPSARGDHPPERSPSCPKVS